VYGIAVRIAVQVFTRELQKLRGCDEWNVCFEGWTQHTRTRMHLLWAEGVDKE
jgi:hypothetical protein